MVNKEQAKCMFAFSPCGKRRAENKKNEAKKMAKATIQHIYKGNKNEKEHE